MLKLVKMFLQLESHLFNLQAHRNMKFIPFFCFLPGNRIQDSLVVR